MAEVTIRRAVRTDLPAIQVLYRQLDDHHALAEPEVVPMHDQASRAVEDIEAQIRDDLMLVAVVRDESVLDGQVAGFARVCVTELGAYFQFPAVAEVEDLAVLEEMRGLGIGKRLMQAAEAWAVSAGYQEIWDSAWTFNEPAASLYRRQGFRPLSTRFRKSLGSRGGAVPRC